MARLPYEYVLKADKLAKENELSRRTKSVGIDPKTNEVTVVQEVADLNGETGMPIREERMFFISDLSKVEIQDAICKARFLATYSFLGLEIPNWTEIKKPEEKSQEDTKPEAVEEEVPKPKKARKTTPRKAKKQAEKPLEVATEVEESPVQSEDDKHSEIEPVVVVKPVSKTEPKRKAASVVFDKSEVSHAVILKPYLEKAWGNWRADESKKEKVRTLVGLLHEKAPITNKKGDVLASFSKLVTTAIEGIDSEIPKSEEDSLPWA